MGGGVGIILKLSSKCEVKGSEVMILGEMCVLSLIYSNVSICRFCALSCVIIICFCMLFSNYSTCVLQYSLYVCLLFCICILYFVYSLLLCCFVYCFSFCAVSFLFFVQVYRPLPPG